MTHKEAVLKALEILGGRAKLHDIYSYAIPLVKYKSGSDIKATLRRLLLTTPELFRPVEGMKGWWELVSFQEEIAKRDRRIAELEEKLATKDEEIAALKKIPKEDDFVTRFVKETKHFFKHERKRADPVRQIMIKVGRPDADKELDSWIEGKEDLAAQAIDRQTEALLKVAARPVNTYNYGEGATHDDKRQQIMLDEEQEKKEQLKQLSNE